MKHPFGAKKNASSPGAARVMQRCDQLATFTSLKDGIKRIYLSSEHMHCNAQVATWMKDAGMQTWTDAAGNIWGRYAAHEDVSDAPVVILGSHLDSVTHAGKYDGILGVLCAIEVVEKLKQEKLRLPFHVDVVGFGDEEGTRFGTTLLGSRAVVGQWQNQWRDLTDEHGITLERAMQNIGLDIKNIHQANRSQENILAYLELHIEQGPQLEKLDQPVGVVSAIAGARRFSLRFIGEAGHAGTVPMELRRDPLVAAALAIEQVEQVAKIARIVATVGKIESYPNSVNVIPGVCEVSLDIRSGHDGSRDYGVDTLFANIQDVCDSRGITFTANEIHNASAVPCASWIQRMAEEVIQDFDRVPVSLVSGAGHDAMVFNELTDIGMLFVRCKGGVSHHPNESVTQADVHEALGVFYHMLLRLQVHKTK